MECHELGDRDPDGVRWIFHRGSGAQMETDASYRSGSRAMIVNTRIITHPMNWIIILMMLVIAGIFGHLTLTLLDQEPAIRTTTV